MDRICNLSRIEFMDQSRTSCNTKSGRIPAQHAKWGDETPRKTVVTLHVTAMSYLLYQDMDRSILSTTTFKGFYNPTSIKFKSTKNIEFLCKRRLVEEDK